MTFNFILFIIFTFFLIIIIIVYHILLNGFKNKTEANTFKSKLKKYIKNKIKYNSKIEIDGDFEVGILENFCTYKYMGAGPSYSCSNKEIKHSDLMNC